MVDLDILAEYELTQENLKKWFNEDPNSFGNLSKEQREKITALREHIKNRVQNGRDWNLGKASVYHALDLAWDAPFRQVNPTLIQSLMGQDVAGEDGKENKPVADKLKSWGIDLSTVIQDVPDPKVKGKSIKKVNVPAFFQVFVPLVRAYVTIRWAKIINDRRLVPFFKYEPAIDTRENRMKCDVITSRVEVMARQIGYFEILKQSVFQMLHYGVCLQFPVEEWWTEEQLVRNNIKNKPAKEKSDDEKKKDEKPKTKKVVSKEGLRYHMPHPTRMFWDQAHRISTFNSDTGCEFAGYWRIVRFRDIYNNESYYNRDLVPLGGSDWWSGASAYFNTVYRCALKFPQPVPLGEGTKDRESQMDMRFYSGANHLDHTVMLTEYFEKIIPKNYGLGTYEHPVWFRFVVCGDSGTVIYAAPLPYCPVLAYTYDSDELREQNASLSLEVLPFQDQFSNLLTQYLLTVQHNLTNLTMVDKDQVEDAAIDKIENNWASRWVRRTIVRFSGRKSMKAQQAVPNAVQSLNFQPLDSNGIIQAMRIILDTLERVLVMSSQEVAQAASHEQTREEIRNIAGSTSSRLTFTETPVDLAVSAWKKQLYSGLMAYGDEGFYAQVPFEVALDKKTIEKLGFTVEEESGDDADHFRERKVTVKVDDKTAIALEAFASSRDGNDRINNVESAVGMATFLRDIVNGPFGPNIGADQFIRFSNEIARLAGFPRDFKLVNKAPGKEPASPEDEKNAAKEQFEQMVAAIESQVVPKVFDALKGPLTEMQQQVQGLEVGVQESLKMDVGQTEAIKTLASALTNLQAALGVSPLPPQEPPPQMPPEGAPMMPPPPMGLE